MTLQNSKFKIPTYVSDRKTTANLNLDTLVKQLKEHVITTMPPNLNARIILLSKDRKLNDRANDLIAMNQSKI
ncbi:hypothetical protein [Nostoc sp.]|uniref:hypothetical protein n=1 Tax=Nostoc sp. TaxID=1180 RepID=UPI002FF936C4